jgi:hypothetical protein
VPLSRDEIFRIRVFVGRVQGELRAANLRRAMDQYCIAPHVSPLTDKDGTILFRRFNCAGFVLEAYRSAGISLLDTGGEALPEVGLDLLKEQYPDFASALDRPTLRERMGLTGSGPWPVVLCGYILNALDRTEDQIRAQPYRANPGDERFPPRPVPPAAP